MLGRVVGILERPMHEHVAVFPVSCHLIHFKESRLPKSQACNTLSHSMVEKCYVFCLQESGGETARSRAEKVRVVVPHNKL